MAYRNNGIVAGTVTVLLAIVFSTAKAICPGCPSYGDSIECMTRCDAMFASEDGRQVIFTTSGVGTFTVVGGSEAERASYLSTASWTGTGTNNELGEVVWSFDDSRPVDGSVIRSIGADAFPATGDLYFHVRGTMEAFPGVVFQSRVPLHLRSENLTTFAPFGRETFTMVEPVPFETADGAEGTGFTLSNLTLEILN